MKKLFFNLNYSANIIMDKTLFHNKIGLSSIKPKPGLEF